MQIPIRHGTVLKKNNLSMLLAKPKFVGCFYQKIILENVMVLDKHIQYVVEFPQKFIQLLSPPEKNVRSTLPSLKSFCTTFYDTCELF